MPLHRTTGRVVASSSVRELSVREKRLLLIAAKGRPVERRPSAVEVFDRLVESKLLTNDGELTANGREAVRVMGGGVK